MIAGLSRARVEHVVVGGVAGTMLGSARFTNDLDICYDPDDGNRRRLAALLLSWNAALRGADPDLPFVPDLRQLRTTPVMTLVTRAGWLDVMDRVAGVGDYPAVLRQSQPAESLGIRFRILTIDALIAAKRAAGRRKDYEALLELEALREIIRRREVRERGARYRARRSRGTRKRRST